MADLTATTVALSPFAYYRLNEATGTVATDTQAHSNGTYVPGYTLGTTKNTANDAISTQFTGGHVSTNIGLTEVGLSGTSMSVSFFCTLQDITQTGPRFVANSHSATGGGVDIYIDKLGSDTFVINYGDGASTTGTQAPAGALSLATLYHVVCVIDSVANAANVYLNTAKGPNGTYLKPANNPTVSMAIGYNPSYNGDPASATISEVAFFNYALSAAQVASIYAARSASSGTIYTSTLTAGLTFVGSQARRTARALNAALSFVGSVSRAIATARTASLSFVGSVAKRSTRAFTATLTFSGVFASAKNAVTKLIAFTAGLTFAGAQTRAVARAFTAIVSTIGTQSKAISKAVAASLPFVGAIARATSRAFAATLAFSGAFTGARNAAVAKFIAFTASVGFAGTQTRSTLRSFFASVATAGAQTKKLSRSMAASVTFAGVQGRIIPTVLAAVLSFAGNLATFFAKGGLTAIGNREYTAGSIGTGKNAPGAAGTGDNPGGSVGNEQ